MKEYEARLNRLLESEGGVDLDQSFAFLVSIIDTGRWN